MGNVYMEADQVRFKNSTYHNLQTAVSAALEGGGGGGTTVIANPEGSATADLAKLQVGTTIYGIPAEAGDISYDNTSSGMTADDVQEAIDELSAAIPGVATTSAPGIVQPDGTSISISNGVISAVGGGGGIQYSETEALTGDTWINNRPIYRKVLHLGALPAANTEKAISTGIAYTSIRCLKCDFVAWDGVGSLQITVPMYISTSGASNIFNGMFTVDTVTNNLQFRIQSTIDLTTYTDSYVIIEYIKL